MGGEIDIFLFFGGGVGGVVEVQEKTREGDTCDKCSVSERYRL